MKEFNAYHFVGDTLRDGREVPENGVTLHHHETLVMCASGLHASRKVWQALDYAPGHILCRVHCGGEVVTGHDKIVCTERTITSRIDASGLLRKFARECALDVIHLWDAPQVVRDYLTSGDDGLRAAARAAARDAAMDAAWAAARDAAWAAARAAAWAAARDPAWAAARDAARAAARDAANKKQRARLTHLVNAAFSEANQ